MSVDGARAARNVWGGRARAWVTSVALVGMFVAGCGDGGGSSSVVPTSYSADPSYEALLNEPGGRDALDACVDVLILQSWGADGLKNQTPAEVAELTDRMLAAGAQASTANMDKYGDFYLDLGRPMVHMQVGDYEAFMDSLASLRAQCESFGFQYD